MVSIFAEMWAYTISLELWVRTRAPLLAAFLMRKGTKRSGIADPICILEDLQHVVFKEIC